MDQNIEKYENLLCSKGDEIDNAADSGRLIIDWD